MSEVTEYIAPFCFGYMTQYWFGSSEQMPGRPTLQQVNARSKLLFSKPIGFGIRAAILENGLVRFDFQDYEGGGIFVYRYRKMPDGTMKSLHATDLEFREGGVQNFAFRLIQVHAVLLDNSRRLLEHCSSNVSRPTRIKEMLRAYDLEEPINMQSLSWKSSASVAKGVAIRSIEDLESVLSHGDGLFELLVLYSFSLTHFLERRYSEALISYWAAVEATVNVLWDRLLASEKGDSAVGLSKKRAERLNNSSAFTASVMIETLYLLRRMPAEIYESLNDVRSIRNKWMHELRPVSEHEALEARRVCEGMLKFVFSFDVKGSIGGGGGAGGGLFKSVFCSRYPAKCHLFE